MMDINTPSASMMESTVEPLCLRDAPALIERLWPAQKISAEAQKERKANLGQTLTALGSYWKGRKPLVLVRACLLGALLPATEDPEQDLAIFEMLMRIDDSAFGFRDKTSRAAEIAQLALKNGVLQDDDLKEYFSTRGWKPAEGIPSADGFHDAISTGKLVWRRGLEEDRRVRLTGSATAFLPYIERVGRSLRPEELSDEAFEPIWERINAHLGTHAFSLAAVVEQLGIMRFGHRPNVADTFAGSGSIPFEAARLGCDVYASDLNPIACMLSWGALNIVGANPKDRAELERAQTSVAAAVNAEITSLGIEHDEHGNRAKAYLYCVETRCPSSGWMVPMLPSRIISKARNVVARLVPDHANRRYDIFIDAGVSSAEMKAAAVGTVFDGQLVHRIDDSEHRTSIKSIRGDFRRADGSTGNKLRLWEKRDFAPREGDIFQERLYCIQWIEAASLDRSRPTTFFAAPTEKDLKSERKVIEHIRANIASWQDLGLVSDMTIEPGYNTDQPIRERGWTHWHHLFNARQILLHALYSQYNDPLSTLLNMKALDWQSRLCRWHTNWEKPEQVFYNQALNTNFTYACRGWLMHERTRSQEVASIPLTTDRVIANKPVGAVEGTHDIYITDPPYADAVNYHEITEFFIAWLRKNAPPAFKEWTWDSRRALAIKGDGEEFRREMVVAYKSMADHMPDNGLQVVMFTHQSGAVWADLAQIFWGAGLQVQAAWYIATETSTELKKGGYVQGTVILVLRKRRGEEAGYEDEIAQEVRAEVARQIDTLVGLNQTLRGAGRIENLFEDADLQMAGYAAALRVLTGYTRIDGRDMTAEALRPRRKGEKGFVERIIEFAVQVANEHMVPDGLTPRLWQQLSGTERFYLKMLDLEGAGLSKLDNYQNLARAFRVPDYTGLMGDLRPNAARIKRADDFKHRTGFDILDFGQGVVRAVLYGIYQLSKDEEADVVLDQVRGMVESYYRRRDDLVEVAEYVAAQRGRNDDLEGRHAAILANLIRNERL